MRRSAQEAQRIALEQNLAHTAADLSFNLDSSVEYGRHLDSAPRSWLRDEDDSEGVHPYNYSGYGGETISTAGHHASALTLSAGLNRRAGADASFATSVEFDADRPLSMLDPVFDKSNELDRLLQSGHSRSVRIRSPPLHSDSESDGPRPKLTDALRTVHSFSPRRPKNTHSSPSILKSRVVEDNNPTPKPRRMNSAPAAPDVQIQPPTPFSKLGSRESRHRMPTADSSRSNLSRRLHLPDMTGLTSAVESPAKGNLKHTSYPNRPRESEARLLGILSSVQSQLNGLEEANSISKRRVRELEDELEDCKREVRRERDKVNDLDHEAERLRKGKGKARDVPQGDVTVRYQEVVEEKKALEALLETLHSHLARLTNELETHQQFLQSLRRLRESDHQLLIERGEEVKKLKKEVGRLGGEVEVLRGVVEDGLRERRARARQQEESNILEADTAMTIDNDPDEEAQEPISIPGSSRVDNYAPPSPPESPPAPEDRTFIHPKRAERSGRTDFATFAPSTSLLSSPKSNDGFGVTSTPVYDHVQGSFIDGDELARIEREVSQRRGSADSEEERRRREPEPEFEFVVDSSPKEQEEDRRRRTKTKNATSLHHQSNTTPRPRSRQERHTRPAAPTPRHAAAGGGVRSRPQTPAGGIMEETPFPQIRGERLERLFFSALPHNAKTCGVCSRRRRCTTASEEELAEGPGGRREREMRDALRVAAASNPPEENEDEGFVEGSDVSSDDGRGGGRERDNLIQRFGLGKKWAKEARRQGIPPQTIITRVIRELEDDFAHYKSVYVEYADAYKVLDAASNVPKRNALAKQLKEVVDVLEAKGDQIASLYDLLKFEGQNLAVGGR